MSIICKFFKRVTLISEKIIWKAQQWDIVLLNKLNIADWEISKIIIFDRNSKFLFDMWKKIFSRLETKLLYFIVYHSQIDDQNERTNQTIKIALRFHIIELKNFVDWLNVLSRIQRDLNNFFFAIIDVTSNEVAYDFTSLQTSNLLRSSSIDLTS